MYIFAYAIMSPTSVKRLGLFHPPFQNPAGEFRLELDFEAEGGGGDGLEGDGVEFVLGDAVVAGGLGSVPPLPDLSDPVQRAL